MTNGNILQLTKIAENSTAPKRLMIVISTNKAQGSYLTKEPSINDQMV